QNGRALYSAADASQAPFVVGPGGLPVRSSRLRRAGLSELLAASAMTSSTTAAATTEQTVPAPVAATVDYLDRRVGLGFAIRGLARKLFPDHWSFLLGEIALYSFIVLILSGIFLTMFFVP